MQPPYQPSGNAPAASDSTKLYADPTKANTLPPQTQATIGDLLDKKGAQLGLVWRRLEQHHRPLAEGDRKFPAAVPPAAQVAELPVPPPALQLLRELRPGGARRRPRRAPEGFRQPTS